ncbi:MAG TPA: DUF2173 family protein [Mycobacterium sp.]|nr:DUF2173 family protein [Mycobacterium sp.]HUH72227.1 DUF2173 family protein [Mycobacterium sp.]
MAASLDDLLNIKGVVAAGEFGLDGSLVDYKANVDFSEEQAQTTARFTAAATQVFNVLAESSRAQVRSATGLGLCGR